MDDELNLDIFIKSLSAMLDAKFTDHKFAILIMCYEYLLTRYLIYLGEPIREVEDYNIQQKLGKLNGFKRFIPSELLDDTLRAEIRNPLFHRGIVMNLKEGELWRYYSVYFDLLIQIALRMLGYTGNYISPIDFKARELINEKL